MSKLLLFIGENEKFDKGEVIEKLTSLGGIKNAREGEFIGAVFECDYERDDFNTIVRLSDDIETITIEGDGDESLDLVLRIKDLLSQPMSVVDMDYSFHVELSSVSSLTEFKKKIEVGV